MCVNCILYCQTQYHCAHSICFFVKFVRILSNLFAQPKSLDWKKNGCRGGETAGFRYCRAPLPYYMAKGKKRGSCCNRCFCAVNCFFKCRCFCEFPDECSCRSITINIVFHQAFSGGII